MNTQGDIKHIVRTQVYNALLSVAEKNSITDIPLKLGGKDGDTPDVFINVEKPNDPSNGDLSTNIAMKVARIFRQSPLVIAEQLKEHIHHNYISEVTIAGAGFINVRLSQQYIMDVAKSAAIGDDSLFTSTMGGGVRTMVEFVSANPTGPLHIGHARSAAYGGALANLLQECGFDIYREYYYNDGGNQINNLAGSIYYHVMHDAGKDYPFPEGGYKGSYIKDIALHIQSQHKNLANMPQEDALAICKKEGVDYMKNMIVNDLKAFGIHHDNWYNEASLYEDGSVERALKRLDDLGYTYRNDGALWLKSEQFGDEKDRVLQKSDGSYTYLTPDIAYHDNKYNRGFEKLIDILGGDHHGYVPRLTAAVEALGYGKDSLYVPIVQMVGLRKGGERIKMSTREDTFVPLTWLVDEVGADIAKFFFLMRSIDSMMDFDVELAKKQSNENPLYYIQYAYVRINSIFDKAMPTAMPTATQTMDENIMNTVNKGEFPITEIKNGNKYFSDQEEAIVKHIVEFKETLEKAATFYEPHRLANYLTAMAKEFHAYYYSTKIIDDNRDESIKRLIICKATQQTIAKGFKILGITPMERM